MKFTVLGGTGFIGRHMIRHLQAQGIEVDAPPRDTKDLRGRKLGHVLYAIGLTGNFRQRLKETIEAHVNILQRLMEDADFESWLYLSSARVYGGLPVGLETEKLSVMPSADSLYDLSKLLGESICLAHAKPAVRIARLSNVYGATQNKNMFLGAVLSELADKKSVMLQESPQSSKDYIAVDACVRILQSIATKGSERIYNVASGHNTTHGEIAACIRAQGYEANFAPDAPTRVFPPISISRIKNEFGSVCRPLMKNLPDLIATTFGKGKP